MAATRIGDTEFNVCICVCSTIFSVVKQDIPASYVVPVGTNCITHTSQEQHGKKNRQSQHLCSLPSPFKKNKTKSVVCHRVSCAGSVARWRKRNGASWRGQLKSSALVFKKQRWLMTHKSRENDRSLFFCQEFKPKRTATVMSDVLMMPPSWHRRSSLNLSTHFLRPGRRPPPKHLCKCYTCGFFFLGSDAPQRHSCARGIITSSLHEILVNGQVPGLKGSSEDARGIIRW